MIHKIAIFLTVLLTSCFYFPFVPTFFPIANTKMVLAALGLVCLFMNWAKKGGGGVDKDIFILTLYAVVVGCVSFFTEVYHATGGNAYVTLFVSMWVWLGAAYFLSIIIEKVHGKISINLICNYLIAVCVFQCIIALSKELYAPMKVFVDSLVDGEGFMGKAEGRMYGIGAALDVAGLRFSAVLTMIAYLCINNNPLETEKHTRLYIMAFFIIGVIGCMISRTTTVGIILSFLYWIYATIHNRHTDNGSCLLWKILGIMFVLLVPILIILYNTNQVFYEQIRFGFEGFFSLYEKGRWETNSNSILKSMVIFPDNLGTWILGDGYIVKPELVDPYYIGPHYKGFYKGTDIGYILFLFYFGIIGLITMIAYIVKTAFICMKKHPMYVSFFIMLLMVNLIGWCKVTSDIFVAFTPFLVLTSTMNSTKND